VILETWNAQLFSAVADALARGVSNAEALQAAFHATSEALQASSIDCRFSGTTAVVAMLQPTPEGRMLTCGFVGDSRCLVGRTRPQSKGLPGLMPVMVTKDHKPTEPGEAQRLKECKALVRPSRVQHPRTGKMVEVGCARLWDEAQIYGVAMSRSLGDVQVHPFLIPVPEVTSKLLDEADQMLFLATDGVWDVMDNDEAMRLASTLGSPKDAAENIVSMCASRWDQQMPGRRDDITCIVADLSAL